MRLKQIVDHKFAIVATMEGAECPVIDFLLSVDPRTEATRVGFLEIMAYLAEHGWHNCSPSWSHEVDKQNEIYEFIKGDFRIFFFKGQGHFVAVCTGVSRKFGQKADKSSVNKAKAMKKAYWSAVRDGTIEVIEDEDA